MARRKKAAPRRRRQTGISLINTAETLVLANVATQTMFNVNVADFLMGGAAFGAPNQITARELFSATQSVAIPTGRPQFGGQGGVVRGATPTTDIIMNNIKSNAVTGIAGMLLVPLAFKVGKRVGRPVISRTNRLLNKSGIGSTVKL